GYTWNTGTAPAAPNFNFVGFANNQYTIFGDKKSTTNTGFDGYSRRSATTLLNNAKCAKGANYSTTWKLVEQPYELYNLVITGNAASTNPTVTYNNAWDNAIQRTPQTNGGGFLIGYDARGLSPNHFTAQELDGHVVKSIAINGKTITVTYKSEVNLTYIYKYGGAEWLRESMVVAPGAYPDLKTPPAGVRYATIPFGKLEDDATFIVNCEISPECRIIPSESFEKAVWVNLSMVDNYGAAKFLSYNANTPNKIAVTADRPSADDSYKWAFVGSPFTGYKIYNKAAGSTKILTSTDPNGDGNTGGNTFIHMETETADMEANGFNTYWTMSNNSLGFFLSRKGQNVYANNRQGTFAFWTGGNDAGSRMFVVPIANKQPSTSLVDSKGASVSGDKQYRIVNRYTDLALTGNAGSYLGRSGRNSNNNQLWTLTANGNGFQIKNAANAYLTGGPTVQKWASTADASSNPTTMYLYEGNLVNGVQYYYINDMAALSDNTESLRHFIGDDSEYIRARGSMAGSYMEWYLEDITPAAAPTVTYATNITSGGYYRLVSNSYGKAMNDNGGGVNIVNVNNDKEVYEYYSQIWQVSINNGNYTFKNLVT
ncbi:MAG: RICIN domain-containing protein, partial [Prevotella sp.]|nr:RICIN domain-containing protein [Prevotella sp.]